MSDVRDQIDARRAPLHQEANAERQTLNVQRRTGKTDLPMLSQLIRGDHEPFNRLAPYESVDQNFRYSCTQIEFPTAEHGNAHDATDKDSCFY